ncbi:ubiquitin carboxyl-terminal hydrolase 7 isoform X4 [Hydra vulgaris]|uniref:Ubiquitin carboxyl-terminal hydrolase 7 n=1 Tax=Hydra vulgaris TaxID=6087 RepID=A0ABM4C9Q0_HYDVU
MKEKDEEGKDSTPLAGTDEPAKENHLNENTKDVEMADEDHCRAEGLITFEVHNVSKIKETVLSEPVIIRNLPWRIMLMPRYSVNQSNERSKSAGVFVQCDPDSDVASWSCQAHAKITLKSHKGEDVVRKISHLFFAKENDWGYSTFVPWNDLIDVHKGYCKNDIITLEAFVQAEAPHGVFWDSKKLTGYVGLKNQGATCYMNSLLQTLFFTNQLRKAVYQMPTENDDINKSVALALQRVFYDLQHSDKPVATKKLTKSFGWETLDSFMQHDAQELCRVLLDNMEMKMKSTVVEGIIPKLLEGKMNSYIQCSNVDYYSSREEPFYDIQLNIKGKTDVIDSFTEYIKAEMLDGDNKYDAGQHGLQDAKKGVIFRHFPPVLHLHLLRFQYDPQTDTNYKINDRYAFPESLNLEKFLEPEFRANAPAPIYTLHAVLVHSGDNHGGHYVVYINPRGDGKWFKFDDDVVSQATKKEAIENNFGGFEDEVVLRHCTNAYMLSYLRTSDLKTILTDVGEDCIPDHLASKFSEEKRLEVQRRKERSEAHLYMDVHIITEDAFYKWSGNDLFDLDNNKTVNFKIQKKEKLCDATKIIAEAFGYTASQCRLWPIQKRANSTTRPAMVELRNEDKRRFETPDDIELFYANDQDPTMLAFLEMLSPDSDCTSLPDFDSSNEVILFFKYYNPKYKTMSYCGHHYVNLHSTPSSLFPMLCKRAGLPQETKLLFYEELKAGQTECTETDKKFDEVVHDLMDGDIICFQAVEKDLTCYELPTPVEYFKDLLHQVQILFCDKTVPSDNGFIETLNLKMNYTQIANAAASTLGVDPLKIQFFKPQIYRDQPGNPVKCSFDGHLKDLVCSGGRKGPKKIYYQVLTMPINELENKVQFKCTFINADLKGEKELVILVDKNGYVHNLLTEAAKVVETVDTTALRLVEISASKIQRIVPSTTLLDSLVQQSQKNYRIEEIPREELSDDNRSLLVPVMHFQKEAYTSFGTPFYIKISEGETLGSLQDRVRKKINMPEKEFDKMKFSLVKMGKVTYYPEDPSTCISLSDFQSNNSNQQNWLGLDHVNKAPKRTRYAYTEKPIKILN